MSYSYLVTNTGNVTLTGIALSDDNDNNDLSCPVTSLAPGQSMTCTATPHVHAGGAGRERLGDGGERLPDEHGDGDVGPGGARDDTLSIPIVQRPRLTLVKVGVLDKTVVPPTDHANPGDRIDYTLTARNTGNVTLHNVAISDPLPRPELHACTAGVSRAGRTARLHGQPHRHAGRPRRRLGDEHGDRRGHDSGGQPIGDNDTSTVLLPPDASITLTKSAAESSFHLVGDVLHYSYVVKNTGNVRLAGPVTVTDDKTTVTCPALSTIGNHDDFLDPGEALTCTATYTVKQSDIDAGKVTNAASALVGGTGSTGQNVTVPFVKLASKTVTDVHDAQHQVVTTVAAGAVVHDAVTVTGQPESPLPSGSVTVDWFTNADCGGPPSSTSGNVALDGTAHAHATAFAQGPLAAGLYGFQAHYLGDATYAPSVGVCESLVVVDANIQIGPNAVNPINAAHTFTAHVNVSRPARLHERPERDVGQLHDRLGPGCLHVCESVHDLGRHRELLDHPRLERAGRDGRERARDAPGRRPVVDAQHKRHRRQLRPCHEDVGGGNGADRHHAASGIRHRGHRRHRRARPGLRGKGGRHARRRSGSRRKRRVPPLCDARLHGDADRPDRGADAGQPVDRGIGQLRSDGQHVVPGGLRRQRELSGRNGACEPLTVTPVPAPKIAIVKNPAKQSVPVGGSAKFKITVTNAGNTVLTNVTVTDPRRRTAIARRRRSRRWPRWLPGRRLTLLVLTGERASVVRQRRDRRRNPAVRPERHGTRQPRGSRPRR